MFALVAIPITPITRSSADAEKKRPSMALLSADVSRYMKREMARMKMTMAR